MDYLIVRVIIGLPVVIAHQRGKNGMFLVHFSNGEVDSLYCEIGSIHNNDSASHVKADRLGDWNIIIYAVSIKLRWKQVKNSYRMEQDMTVEAKMTYNTSTRD